jgi:hypothetical protein
MPPLRCATPPPSSRDDLVKTTLFANRRATRWHHPKPRPPGSGNRSHTCCSTSCCWPSPLQPRPRPLASGNRTHKMQRNSRQMGMAVLRPGMDHNGSSMHCIVSCTQFACCKWHRLHQYRPPIRQMGPTPLQPRPAEAAQDIHSILHIHEFIHSHAG